MIILGPSETPKNNNFILTGVHHREDSLRQFGQQEHGEHQQQYVGGSIGGTDFRRRAAVTVAATRCYRTAVTGFGAT